MIYKYLLEIKYRSFFSFITWSFTMINCYYFKETLLYLFMRFSLDSNKNSLLYFLTTDVAEVFIAYLQLSYYIANQITVIFISCQLLAFVSSGLYLFEYIYLKNIILAITICWLTSIFMLHNFIFPASWDFFLKFQKYLSFQNLTFYFEVKLNEYLIFYKSIYYLCSLVFQTVVFFFIFLDLFKTNLLIIKKFRKVSYFLFFIFSTFLTPPEVMYQLIMGICIIIIYELITLCIIFKTELANIK